MMQDSIAIMNLNSSADSRHHDGVLNTSVELSASDRCEVKVMNILVQYTISRGQIYNLVQALHSIESRPGGVHTTYACKNLNELNKIHIFQLCKVHWYSI